MRKGKAAELGGQVVSLPQGFGNAVSAQATTDQLLRGLQIAQVAGRNVERPDSVP